MSTGIPNLVRMYRRISMLEDKINLFGDKLDSNQQVTISRFDRLDEKIDAMPKNISEHITEEFTIQGQVLGRSDFSNFREQMMNAMITLIRETENRFTARYDQHTTRTYNR
jgi:hypothetical protein